MIRNIFWDFDGVIVDSVGVKSEAFRFAFRDFPEEMLCQLSQYHHDNPGITRWKKIDHFFDKIALTTVPKNEKKKRAEVFSEYVIWKLSSPSMLIQESNKFIRENVSRYNFHIISASDHDELQVICDNLRVSRLFRSIHGAPEPKDAIVLRLIKEKGYKKEETIFIGDSMTDLEAAKKNGITFYGFNSALLKKTNNPYIDDFASFLN